MYWYFTYKFRKYPTDEWKDVADIFEGTFCDLILMAAKQPEYWIVTYSKEISKEDYDALFGEIG